MTNKAALLKLPLKTHVDMVTLTLDNLDVKLSTMSEAQDAMSVEDVEMLRHLSMRLMQQRVRNDREIEERVARCDYNDLAM